MKYFIGILILIIVAVGGFFAFRNNDAEAKLVKPWVEVLSAEISELSPEDKTILRELETGDELESGAIIKTDATGSGNIYFPDGSNISLDPNTEITLKSASYDDETETLIVKVVLEAGRIWSKVIGLATPESEWQVETANAVATVRGTAFGSVYLNNETNFVGSENDVEVGAKDLATGEEIAETKTTITTDDFVVINNKIQEEAKKKAVELAKKKLDNESLREWVSKEREKNKVLDERIQKLKDEGLSAEEIRTRIREDLQSRFRSQILERREILQERIESSLQYGDGIAGFSLIRDSIIKALVESGKTDIARQIEGLSDQEFILKLQLLLGEEWLKNIGDPEAFRQAILKLQESNEIIKDEILNQTDTNTNTTNTTGTISDTKALPKSLDIKPSADLLKPVTEGTSISFKAILLLSDGTTRDVTSNVKWQVLGPIGAIDAVGNFRAKISPEFVELGEASGTVVATWQNLSGDINLLGKTSIFKVVPAIDNTLLQG